MKKAHKSWKCSCQNWAPQSA